MTQKYNQYFKYIFTGVALFLCLPLFAFAQEFAPLVPLPGIKEAAAGNFQSYINTFIKIAVIAAALIAVAKLVLAGVQYVLADVVTTKENAKKDIKWSLIGLLIVLSAVTILTRINPQFTNLPILTPLGESRFDSVPLTEFTETEKRITAMCKDEVGNCEIMTCNQYTTTNENAYYVGYVPEGLDYVANQLSPLCRLFCRRAAGEMVGSTHCIYPNDAPRVRAAEVQAEFDSYDITIGTKLTIPAGWEQEARKQWIENFENECPGVTDILPGTEFACVESDVPDTLSDGDSQEYCALVTEMDGLRKTLNTFNQNCGGAVDQSAYRHVEGDSAATSQFCTVVTCNDTDLE
jgi:hypothetical protein